MDGNPFSECRTLANIFNAAFAGTQSAADCAEETDALFKVSHDRSMSLKEYERSMSMTSEELKADFKSAINEYINKYCKIDRVALMKLFNNVRYGK